MEFGRFASERLFSQEPHAELRLERLTGDMRAQAETLPPEDATEASFYTAALGQLECNPDFKGLLHTFLKRRPELAPSHDRYLPLRCFQKFALRHHPEYRYGFDADQWTDLILESLADKPTRLELEHDLFNRHLQTNIPDRYKSLPLLVEWLRTNGRVGRSLNVLDIGCSVNHGLKKLSLMDIVPGEVFGDIKAMEPQDIQRPWRAFTEAPVLTEKINRLQNLPIGLAVGIGVDREDMSATDNEEWARACLTPREHQDHTVEQHDKLDMIRPKNVLFVPQDMLSPDEAPFMTDSPEHHGFFDLVTLFTVMNQLTIYERYRIMEVARRYVKDTGLLVIQDFARVNPDVDIEIDFLFQDWNRNFSYRTIVMDMQRPGHFQEALLYDGGRCRVVQPALGSLALGHGRTNGEISFEEFLRS